MANLPETAGPLYEKVKDYILDHIGSGAWGKDQRVPSEHELVSMLGVSRMTVHRALRELTSDGHLIRIQGVGTFVAPPKPYSTLIEIVDIASEIRARGARYRADIILLESLQPSQELLAAFDFATRKPVGHSMILHHENDMPVMIEERFVNSDLAPDYDKQDFSAVTTYDFLQKSTPLTEVEQVIAAITADEDTARMLALEAGAPCLLLHRRTWTGSTVATVNRFTYSSRYTLGSRYAPSAFR
ncbi:GntR family histidine utilization transcriptional repressor [Rhizobium sp. SG_E_25_P2]|uniref:histidine utilization repressor n=1 Tax=Rhizobium sp. SG_E_25_P2 TaxID=2879942 RepID=UPI002473D299|nr:histidine utilization repressor [Rhizobium sp. SG_E_25_P2]MDH6265147.1 GntR family histidine utilization transcriptional repressor [Rhizobium sp. SG_E_25_P2]